MNGEFTLVLAFMTGLLGAGHCLGMCSGLAGGFALHQHHWRKPLIALAYHGSRIGVYVLLGALGAALGRVLVQVGALGKLQGILMIGAGLLIVALALGLLGLIPALIPARCSTNSGLSRWQKLSPALAGILNGLVPCSLVFSVALRATATADPTMAALLMLSFGLGTLPAMGTLTLLAGHLGCRARGIMRQLSGLIVLALGGWTIYEGAVFYQVMSGLAN